VIANAEGVTNSASATAAISPPKSCFAPLAIYLAAPYLTACWLR
jgi:hypothetical protein